MGKKAERIVSVIPDDKEKFYNLLLEAYSQIHITYLKKHNIPNPIKPIESDEQE